MVLTNVTADDRIKWERTAKALRRAMREEYKRNGERIPNKLRNIYDKMGDMVILEDKKFRERELKKEYDDE